MEYKKLVLIAPAWREELDPKTNILYLRADFSSSGFCETIMTPIPGTDPVEYTYDCLPVTCQGLCELRKRELPGGGIIYYCACSDGNGGGATVASAKRSKSTSGKGVKKKAAGKTRATKAASKKPRKPRMKR